MDDKFSPVVENLIMNYVFLNCFLNSELRYLRHHSFKLGNSVQIYRCGSTVRPGMWRSQMMWFVSFNQAPVTFNRRICVWPQTSYNCGQRIRLCSPTSIHICTYWFSLCSCMLEEHGEADHSPPASAEVKKCGSTHSFPHTPSWRSA
jgi:hypothetical protein